MKKLMKMLCSKVTGIGLMLALIAPGAFADLTITNLQLVSSARVSRVAFEYTYQVEVTNSGEAISAATGSVVSNAPATNIIDAGVAFGAIPSGGYALSTDTITLRQNRRYAFDMTALTWSFNSEGVRPPEGMLLNGAPDTLANDALEEFDANKPVGEEDIATTDDAILVVLTKLELSFNPDTAVSEVNALLDSLKARIVQMSPDFSFVVIQFPNPGTLNEYFQIVQAIMVEPIVEAVVQVGFRQPAELPSQGYSSVPLNIAQYYNIDHHLAVRAPAAWNARDLLNGGAKPTLIVYDTFGNGKPGAELDMAVDCVSSDAGGTKTNVCPEIVSPLAPKYITHGDHVAGIVGATYADANPAVGMFPSRLNAKFLSMIESDGIQIVDTSITDRLLWQMIENTPGNVILNTSLSGGLECSKDHQDPEECLVGLKLRWMRAMKPHESRVFHVNAAGNGFGSEIQYASDINIAALWTHPGILDLTNTLIVQNRGNTMPEAPRPQCDLADSSNVIKLPLTGTAVTSVISAIGEYVSSLPMQGTVLTEMHGTSMATPQVAGVAAMLWTLDNTLSPEALKNRLYETASMPCDNYGSGAPAVDAYAAVLAADSKLTTNDAKVRLEILDVAAPAGFDDKDIAVFIKEYSAREKTGVENDYSRYDLNGDGYTGGPSTARFDLDADRVVDGDKSTVGPAEAILAEYDETQVTDWEILCYYAYSPLFPSSGDTKKRDLLIFGIADKCGLTLKSVTLNINSAGDGSWKLPAQIELSNFGGPSTFYSGSFSSPSCSGERGWLLHSSVPSAAGADFRVPALVIGAPAPTGVFPNYRGCSDFIAVTEGQVWATASQRRRSFSAYGSSDREYQTRYYSGSPENDYADGYVRLGSVVNPYAGFAQQVEFGPDAFEMAMEYESISTGSPPPAE